MIGQHKAYENGNVNAASFWGTCKSSAIIIMNYETITLALMEAARGPHTPTVPVTGTQATNWQMMIKCRVPDPTVDLKRLTQTQTQLDSTSCCKHYFLTGLGLDPGCPRYRILYGKSDKSIRSADGNGSLLPRGKWAETWPSRGSWNEGRLTHILYIVHHYYNKCFHLISLK